MFGIRLWKVSRVGMWRRLMLAALLVVMFAQGSRIPAAHAADAVVAIIPVGNGPSGVAVNPTTNRIYVANIGNYSTNGTLSVIDGRTDTVIATIPVGRASWGVGVNVTTNRVYVISQGIVGSSGAVWVIDGLTNTVIATVDVGGGPGPFVGVNPTTNRIYVPNSSGYVSVIDGLTNTITATIGIGVGYPDAVAVNPTTNRIYVTSERSTFTSGTVSVIDGLTNTIIARIDVGLDPFDVAVNPATNRIYVTNFDTGIVSVIDGLTNTLIDTIATGTGPVGVAVNPTTNRVYVANQGPYVNGYYDGSVTVIDALTDAVINTISVGHGPWGVAVNPTTNRAYVANEFSNTVSVIADEPPTTALKVQYQIGNPAATTNLIKPFFKIINMGDAPVPLNELTVRYWYTWDTRQPQTDHCIWAMGSWYGCLSLTKTFVRVLPPRLNADYYLEFGFTSGAGMLSAHSSSQAIINWFYKQDWSAYNQTNDYSFNPLATTYVDNPRMTLYRNGVLIWGVEPGSGASTVSQPVASSTPQSAPTFVPKP
jgi:YVTN family beta-propeller protein